jgi:alpha-tubulin suppressor-like RCC1 family protein
VTFNTGTTVFCWGLNDLGQLGDNDGGTNRASPQPVAPGEVSVANHSATRYLAIGANHACARLLPNGNVACWGANGDGQLGVSGGDSDHPVLTMEGAFYNVDEVTAGGNQTCVRVFFDGVYCWGRNAEGQLGIGTTGAGIDGPVRIIQ